ncbi:MAG: DUF1573 domain-containing protein [Terriglobia bacterium]|jgi:hypothetical protein
MRIIKQRVGSRILAAWLLVGLCLLVAGTPVIASSSSEEALRARVEQCYSALQQGDWPKVEKYLTKDSKPIFRGQTKKPLLAYKIQSIKLDPDGQTATVVVQVPLMSAAMPRPIPVPNTTLWRLKNRVWYMELSRPQPDANAHQELFNMAPKVRRAPAPVVTSKDLKFESKWCGLGNIQSGETPVAKFPFKNVSTHSVTLAEIQLGCDCLRLKTQQKEYKPGESGTLEIEFDPASLGLTMEESFSQVVVMKTEPGDAYVLLTIAARVAPAPQPPAKP